VPRRGNDERPFARRTPNRTPARSVIIVCEGKRTEYDYFEAIRKTLRLPTVTVQVVHSGATDPRSIVRKALELRKEREQEQRWSTEDTAWAVFDGDEHRLHDPANWNDAFQIAGKKVRLAVSNPCFEFWYLLHYQDQQGYLDRDTARRILKTYLPTYEKKQRTLADTVTGTLGRSGTAGGSTDSPCPEK
jgi:hypothetical protein